MATKQAYTTLFTTSSPVYELATNNTTSALPPPGKSWKPSALWRATFKAVEISCSLEAALVLFFNVALLLLIVTSPTLRRQMKYHLVLSLVAANLTQGLFSAPFLVDYVTRRTWVHGCYFNVIRTLLAIFVQNFVSMWGVVLLLLHYVARMFRYEGPAWLVRLPAWLHKSLPALIVASPWIFGVIVQIPFVFAGLHPHTWVIWNESRCPLILLPWTTYFLTCTCYFIPTIILIILVVIIGIRNKDHSPTSDQLRRAEMGTSLVPMAGKERMESGVGHVVVAILSIVLMTPEHLFYGLRMYLYLPAGSTLISAVVSLILSELLPFVVAVVWLLMYPEMRDRMAEVAGQLPCCAAWCGRLRSPPLAAGATSVGPVSFRDLRDNRECVYVSAVILYGA